MGAARETAPGDQVDKLDEVGLDLAGVNLGQLELADAGRVDDVAAEVPGDETRSRRGVAAALEVGKRADLQIVARVESVDERALADAALANDGRGASSQHAAQIFQPAAV